MRNKKKITVLVLSVICISVLALAGKQVADKYAHRENKINLSALPPAKDEYTKLVQHFLHPDSASVIKGTVKLYDGASPERVKEKSDFISIRDGSSFYSKISFTEVICDGKWYVQIDTLHKQLLITALNENQVKAPLSPAMGGLFDRLFSDTATFKVSGTVTGNDLERLITIKSDFNPEIQYFTLRYSPADYSIRGAEIRFWKNRRPDADTTEEQKNSWITKIEYRQAGKKLVNINDRINQVFKIKGHTMEPAAAYHDYKVALQ